MAKTIMEGGVIRNQEYLFRSKSGRIFLLSFTAEVIEISGIPHIITLALDITDQKRAEDALRENEQKYRNILETMEEGYYEVDLAGNFTYVNDSMSREYMYTKEELLGLNYRDYVDKESAKRIFDVFNEIYRTGKAQTEYDYVLIRKNGTKRYIEASGSLIKDPSGQPVGFKGIGRDVTERREMEEVIRQSEEKYRTIIEQMEDGYFEADLTGSFTFVNDAESKILGYSKDELIGMNYRRYQSEKSAQKVFQEFSRLYITGEPVKVLGLEIIRKDGTKGFHEVSVSLIKNNEGKPTGFRGISRDFTERKQAEEEKRSLEERLNRAEKMEALGQLAGGVAHDLNNVLGVLSGYSELLLMQIPEGQKARNHAEKILQSTEKGAAIIQDLLTLARRGVTSSDVINLNSIVSDFLKTPVFENVKNYHPRVTFRTECQDDLLNIKGSPVHLEKTLMNLVSNAAESISGKGEVTIRTENRYLDSPVGGYDEIKEGDYTILIVSDTGMGIPAEHIEKIFEPFYTKKVMGRSGTGLGLAIVWGTVKDHHGYIDVQTKVEEGTTFTLYFPVTREELTRPQQKLPVERYTGKGESILVVDDIAEQREVASGLLNQLRYEVHTVSSGEEAVEYLKSNKADILVLDMIMLPGIDGLETYQRVLEINPKQKAVLVSGFSETTRVRKAQKLGAGAYVKKPYVMEKIGVAIRNELNR